MTRAIRTFLAVEAATFVLASLIHAGYMWGLLYAGGAWRSNPRAGKEGP